jgi:ribosome biogenesis protein UTP30
MTAAKTAMKSPMAKKKQGTVKDDTVITDKSKSLKSTPSAQATTIGPESALVEKAVRALLKYHEKSTQESEKQSLLGNDRPMAVQFTLLRAPSENRPKPIPIVVPHPFFKTFEESNDDEGVDAVDNDNAEEPEICLIVKEESKPWCQDMIAKFPDHMGGIKKVLGLDSLRKKHCGTYEQRRQLLHKYNLFLADDRILPMLSKLLGKAFIQSKRLPVPISITREHALPFAVQKALTSTYMTLNKGTCVSVRAGHTGMTAEQLVANVLAICDGSDGAIPKLPRRWANVQMIGLKTADSTLLPIYNQTPEALREIAEMAGLDDVIVGATNSSKKLNQKKSDKADTGHKKKRELKSPLLKALKKQKREEEAKEKATTTTTKQSLAGKDKEGKGEKIDQGSAKRSSLSEEKKKSKVVDEHDETVEKKAKKSKASTTVQESPNEEKREFVASKKFKGSKKGYVFRMGTNGLGYYIDVKPVVNPMAIDAIMRLGSKGKSNSRRGGSKKNKYKGTRRF